MANTAKVDNDGAALPGTSSHPHADTNSLQLPPSQSSLSVRSDCDDSSAGYITASSSRVSHIDAEPLTALPRISLDTVRSSTPVKNQHPSFARSPSSDSMTTTAGHSSSNDTSSANLASLSSVTTFVPSTLTDLDTSDEDDDDGALGGSEAGAESGDGTAEFVPNYDFDLRDPHERTMNDYDGYFEQDDQGDATEQDQTLTAGDVITVSHSHSTSINTYNDSASHSRSASQPGTTIFPHDSPNHHSSHFPISLSSSWPSLALPPSAVKLHRKRRSILLRLLKTWEGREQVLHLTHSLVLVLYSSLDHPVPQTYRSAIMRPAGAVLAMSFPKPVRVALMQRIYTTAEGIDNFRRVILIARWVTAATEAVMEHWQNRQVSKRREVGEVQSRLTGEEPVEKRADHLDGRVNWLQPPSIAPLDAVNADEEEQTGGEQGFSRAPASKLGKATGRGDATGAVGADVAENVDAGSSKTGSDKHTVTSSTTVSRTFAKFWSSLTRLTHLEAAAESLATIGEACETAAVLAGGGMFWRAVGIQRLGLPFLSSRRRKGIERLGIVLSLCSVLLSLLVLRIERKALRAQLRSAHRRIIRANDKLGWATELAGTTIERDQALSHRKRDPSVGRARSQARQPLEMLGPDLQDAARELDDQDLSASDSASDSGLSDTWTVVPDADDTFTAHYRAEVERPRRRTQQHSHGPKPIDVSSLIQSTERSLVRAESDLRRTRRSIKLNFWEKVANLSESVFLSYEAAAPHMDKDATEGWTGLLASAIRLTSLWRQISWGWI
ncbi:hypothetical protein EX895_002550 [Sporisorium graminicola]|uniref:Uncharacterized protein n=1 Tax=Sporisorium graminicola TaxID=280036 RepID=A0A4U7KVC4_9BASI|nr:hypothetical protein EX895_002550 [Sporisorium graminicola]TKY88561.1 hypothetical protein EX895_002550 [Sporisorium graminicola]